MIESIRLVNCQSWEDNTIHLSPTKLNVIEAPNNVGKSVLIKILEVSVSPTFFKAKKRKKLIRWGAQEARAYYKFSDGAVAAVVIQQTRVVYFFKESDEDKFVGSTEPPQRLIDELGIMINSDGSFIANIIDTDQNLLLVDSDSKSTYEFIDMLCNNASLDELHERVAVQKKWADDNISSVDARLGYFERQIQQVKYTDVEQLEQRLERISLVKNSLYTMITAARSLERFGNCTRHTKDYNKLLQCADTLLQFECVNFKKLSSLEEPMGLELVEILEKLERINFDCLGVKKEPANYDLVKILEDLESLDFAKFQGTNRPPEVTIVNSLVSVEKAIKSMSLLREHNNTAEAAERLYKELEQEFRNAGREYDCPVYGKVIFDGEKCVSCDY